MVCGALKLAKELNPRTILQWKPRNFKVVRESILYVRYVPVSKITLFVLRSLATCVDRHAQDGK